MSRSSDERVPTELRDVEARLQDDRAQASPLELDRIKRRARAQASRPSPAIQQKGSLMRRPTFVTTLLMAGVLVAGTGAAQLAGVLPDGADSAGRQQYEDDCSQLVRQNREEERALRRQNRAEERTSRSREVRRENREEERGLREQNREEERQCRDQDRRAAAERFCRAERNRLGERAFREEHGTNRNDRNAFGKCVSERVG